MSRKKTRRLSFEGLERREVLSTVVFESEPNDRSSQADIVQFDTADKAADVSGKIASRNDQDFFRFRASASDVVNLTVVDSPSLVAKITVEDGRGQKLFESEPNNGVNSGSFAVSAGQNIFIRVRGQDKTTGDYTVHLKLGALPSSVPSVAAPGAAASAEPANLLLESEPNDTKAAANRAQLGSDGLLRIQGVSRSDRDKDFFVLRPTTSGMLSVNVTSTSAGKAKFVMEDALGRKIFETEPNNGINSGRFTVTAGTTYFMRLRSADSRISPYLVDLALT
jgi:hypothetical protein